MGGAFVMLYFTITALHIFFSSCLFVLFDVNHQSALASPCPDFVLLFGSQMDDSVAPFVSHTKFKSNSEFLHPTTLL